MKIVSIIYNWLPFAANGRSRIGMISQFASFVHDFGFEFSFFRRPTPKSQFLLEFLTLRGGTFSPFTFGPHFGRIIGITTAVFEILKRF